MRRRRMSLYDWQKECLELIKDRNAVISAPTNAGKTRVAYMWMEPALAREGKHRIIYTSPLKALANEKCDELISLYGKDMVGIETGDVKRRSNAPILVCTQEIYTLRYSQLKQECRVIIDEFHYIFSDNQRTRAYIEGIKRARPTHKLLIMSATLSDPEKIRDYLVRTTGKDFVLYHTDFRPTRLTYTDKSFSLHDIPPYTLIYIFNTRSIDRLAKRLSASLPPLPLIKRRKIKLLAVEYRINLDKFPEIYHGVARYHSKLTYTEKRFIERLVREGYIQYVLATNALGVGVNLPFEWVLFGNLFVPNGGEQVKPITKIDFVQLAGRAGRKGYFDEGFVGFLLQDFTYEGVDKNRQIYGELLKKPLEEPVIKLEIDIWSVIKGERTLEEEVEYVVEFSEPKRDRKEVEEMARRIKETLSGASQLELEFLTDFYQPELSLKENLYLAKLVINARLQETEDEEGKTVRFKQIFLTSLGADKDNVNDLLLLRRIGRRLNRKRFKGVLLVCPDLRDIEERIKELDPLVLEVGL